MLKRLSITNYALIDRAHIEFGPGLTAMTGETGAGKSLVVGAISTLVGEKISPDVIGQKGTTAVVEGDFDISQAPDVKAILEEHDFDVGDSLLLRREITAKRSRGLINDQVATLTQLKQLTEKLLDLHGQHQHQSLLRTSTHLEYLDAFGGHHNLLTGMEGAYRRYQNLSQESHSLEHQLQKLRQEEELQRHELGVIQKANPQPDEDQILEQEAHMLEHSEEFVHLTHDILEHLHDSEHAVLTKLDRIQHKLERLKSLDSSWKDIAAEAQTTTNALKEIAHFARDFHHRIEFAPDRLEQVRERLQNLAGLKRRFGGSLDAVIARANQLKNQLQQSTAIEDRIAELKPQLKSARDELIAAAETLSQARKTASEPLETKIKQLLSQVGIPSAAFEVHWDNNAPDKSNMPGIHGWDRVEYYLSTNPGEPPRPLTTVASGGEISRIMLALKTALAGSAGTYTMVFDEIDIGISGRVARKVGNLLKQLANQRQVIVVTHLPQIASLGHQHLKVSKRQRQGQTVTEINPLEPEERLEEIASLMAGAKVTDRVRASAQELLTNP
jgi:DNA repair protein RecN (Recombination protein N)